MAKVQKMLVSLDLRGNELRNVVLGTEVGTAPGAIWFDLATSTVKFVDADNTVQSIEPKSYVDAAVAGEAATRASEVTRLEGLISAETAARQSAVAAEAATRQNVDNQIIANLTSGFTQGSNRMTAIEAKNTQQDGRLDSAESAITSLQTSVASEASRAQAAESALATDIAAVAADVAALDNTYATDAEVSSAVAAEATARNAAISSAVAAEASSREAADNALASDLASETSARTAADSALDVRVTAAEGSITDLTSDLATEVSRAQAAEGVLDTRVTATESDIAALETSLATESSARAAADTTLQSNIDAEAAARAAADSAEATARAAGDASLQSSINTLIANNQAYAAGVSAAFTADRTRLTAIEGVNETQNSRLDTIESTYATKSYVDGAIQGLDITESVKAAAQTVSSTSGLDAVDGVSLSAGDRVLVLSGANAGIWTVASGAWTSVAGPDAGTFVFVEGGSVYGSNGYVLSASEGWVQFSGAGQVSAGAGLAKSGNELSVSVGNGLKIEGDAVQLDGPVSVANGGTGASTASAARANLGATGKHSELLEGDGTTDAFVVTHSLASEDVVVSVRDAATGEMVMVSVAVTSSSTVSVEFASAPANGEDYKVVIVG